MSVAPFGRPRAPQPSTSAAAYCPHCDDLRAEIAHLQSELGVRRKAGDLLRLTRAFGLTPSEAAIVLALSRRALTVLTRLEIAEVSADFAIATRGEGDPDGEASRGLASVHVSRIRRKMGAQSICTLHGRGYALSPEAREQVSAALAADPA